MNGVFAPSALTDWDIETQPEQDSFPSMARPHRAMSALVEMVCKLLSRGVCLSHRRTFSSGISTDIGPYRSAPSNSNRAMRKVLIILPLSMLASASIAQDIGQGTPPRLENADEFRAIVAAPKPKAPARREGWNEMYDRHRAAAKRSVRSMCDECLGAKHNKPGPETPLILPEELSNYQGEPQLEREP